jgi:hypothetical protein
MAVLETDYQFALHRKRRWRQAMKAMTPELMLKASINPVKTCTWAQIQGERLVNGMNSRKWPHPKTNLVPKLRMPLPWVTIAAERTDGGLFSRSIQNYSAFSYADIFCFCFGLSAKQGQSLLL